MSTDRIQYLLECFFQQTCTIEEKEELALWIDILQDDDEWKTRLQEIWGRYLPDEKIDPEKAATILKAITNGSEKQATPGKTIIPLYKRLAAAAAVVFLIAASLVYFLKKPSVPDSTISEKLSGYVKDINPGGNKAVLTLADGTKMTLDSMQNGPLVQLGSVKVTKINSGLLSYETKKNTMFPTENRQDQNTIGYNTLITPRGGEYQLVLPDGSRVWLNAASSLHFPTLFKGKERRVEISGEAYFEITKNADVPFIVDILSPGGKLQGTVKVLGTHFNINAYSDEDAVKTTLIEGTVKVTDPALNQAASGQILSPGEQAVIHDKGPVRIVKKVNIGEITAWKNGLFDFEGNDIQSVMRQIARWYDVNVKYENISSAHFVGTISRSADIYEVLKMLEMTGAVHFKIKGKTITVLK